MEVRSRWGRLRGICSGGKCKQRCSRGKQRALVGSSEETCGWGARKSGRRNSKRPDLFLDVWLRL